MSTKLLAEKNGNISIVEVEKTSPTCLTLRYPMEEGIRRVFTADQGKKWELFLNVDDATKWIHKQNKAPAKFVKPGSRLWLKREKEVKEGYAPAIVACNNCGSPRHKQYKCLYCDKE
jgi:hypothetical protein